MTEEQKSKTVEQARAEVARLTARREALARESADVFQLISPYRTRQLQSASRVEELRAFARRDTLAVDLALVDAELEDARAEHDTLREAEREREREAVRVKLRPKLAVYAQKIAALANETAEIENLQAELNAAGELCGGIAWHELSRSGERLPTWRRAMVASGLLRST
jgi:DNA repair exonuclease SbcCD ATPase subunit